MPVFELNLTDLRNFRKIQHRSPKLFAAAATDVLNAAAFGTRKLALRELRSQSTIRNEGFLKRSVLVKKSRKSGNIDSMEARVGSIQRPRFSGWREQEGGQQTKREHLAKPAARRGDLKRQIVRTARLQRSGRFPQPRDFRGPANPVRRAIRMIHILSKSGFTKPFLIFGLENSGKTMPPGLYRFGSGQYPHRKIELLQRFKKPKKTRRDPWLQPATAQYIRHVDLRIVWGRALARELRRGGVRV